MNVNRSIQAIFDDESTVGDTASQASRGSSLAGGGRAKSSKAGGKTTRFADTDAQYAHDMGSVAEGGERGMNFRAEKLIDTTFLRALFHPQTKLSESQELLRKLSDVLELMEANAGNKKGLVKWEVFSKVLLSLAPPHILRADVTTFLDAQVDDPESEVNIMSCITRVVNSPSHPPKTFIILILMKHPLPVPNM
jgi:hypothetical protein